ncbi:TPA: hypothetical protein DIC20_03435 [Candidatus Dependentiae bacterium]|nr:MAG: hypothetical protein US03_C0001G0076 [candidate division TM6 bacterium GW2011_GWF2_36_131]KKQ03788.1 MAG: hypothetical protein US13_C0001G0128 [candidate division TM6 bacterium GW2011_GWE2_36_25]KKQ19934.1 MAG: hypothetical protein US32_C0003G0051 [candidate division TM6 bacterium GW2011_GWA2_36_9]HBR70556.1 hypothetical protein [Candidatus Dependentiae bacterium]HCU00728.1 hypothetical protein [Candidatus Dependentiae bacterium]
MRLHIATPSEKRELEIAWIELNTPAGNFIIQPEHAPMIVTLSPMSIVNYRLTSGKEETRKVIQGIAHIERDYITLLITQ